MTTDIVRPALVTAPPARLSLLWTIPLTLLWGWLIYRIPVLVDSGFSAMAARLMSYGLIALGLWFGLLVKGSVGRPSHNGKKSIKRIAQRSVES